MKIAATCRWESERTSSWTSVKLKRFLVQSQHPSQLALFTATNSLLQKTR